MLLPIITKAKTQKETAAVSVRFNYKNKNENKYIIVHSDIVLACQKKKLKLFGIL